MAPQLRFQRAGRIHHLFGISGYAEQVTAQTAIQLCDYRRIGGQYVKLIVTFSSIQFQIFNFRIIDRSSGSDNSFRSDHKYIGKFGADDPQRIISIAAVYIHQTVDDILDRIRTLAGIHSAFRGSLFREGTDDKHVISFIAEQIQYRHITEYNKFIIAAIAFQNRHIAHTIAQISACGLDRFKLIKWSDIRICRIPLGLEYLSHLEMICPLTAENRRFRPVVIQRDVILTAKGFHREMLQIFGIVHPLHIHKWITVQEGNERHPAFLELMLACPQQHIIRLVRSIYRQSILAVVCSRIEHINDIIRTSTTDIHEIDIRTTLTIQVKCVAVCLTTPVDIQ